MIHGLTRESVLQRLQTLVEIQGLQGVRHEVLFSIRAFKQCGARYATTRKQEDYRGVAHG